MRKMPTGGGRKRERGRSLHVCRSAVSHGLPRLKYTVATSEGVLQHALATKSVSSASANMQNTHKLVKSFVRFDRVNVYVHFPEIHKRLHIGTP